MDPKWKAKWLVALRSGEFKQGTGRLRNDKGEYCCLGVLCEIISRSEEGQRQGLEWKWNTFAGDHQLLSARVQMFTGIAGYNPVIRTSPTAKRKGRDNLARANDRGNKFTTIARYIEREL